MTRGKFIIKGLALGLSLALVACADGFVLPTITADTTPGKPTTTETSPTATEVAPTPTITETPAPTEAPMPVELKNLPEGLIAVHNEDGSWGIGREVNGETVAIPGINFSEDKLMLNLGDGKTVDITDDINAINIVDHPSGAEIIDMGERTGFVWKGDKWAEILLQIKFETNGENINNFPEIALEDVTSGALAEAERLEAKPLPDTVIPITKYYILTSYGYGIVPELTDEQRSAYNTDGTLKPMRPVFFYDIEINGMPLVLLTLQVKTPDGSYKYMHGLRSPGNLNTDKFWMSIINLTYMPFFDLAIFDDPNASCENPPYKYPGSDISKKVTCPLNQPDHLKLEALASQMVETGNIPDEFERKYFLLMGGTTWY